MMHKTKNNLPPQVREKLVGVLNQHLAQAIDTMLQGKQAHWNVKGPDFIALHELFDQIVESAEEWVDNLAERAVTLGGVAEGTVQAIAGRSKLPAYNLEIFEGLAHVDALSTSLATFGSAVRSAIAETSELDADTADLFTEISREVDKYVWFLEAHLQSAR